MSEKDKEASELNHHVGYSPENECWFVRFYPFQTEQQAVEFTRPAPVSPDATGKCGELVRYSPEAWSAEPRHYSYVVPDANGEYVRFDQAVELLVAERAKKEMLAESLHIQIKRVNELEADNAAKDAELKAAKEYGDKWFKYYSDLREPFDLNEIERRKLETKLAAAEKALDAIEDHAARCFSLSTHSTTALAYLKDIQDEARAARGGKPS